MVAHLTRLYTEVLHVLQLCGAPLPLSVLSTQVGPHLVYTQPREL